MLDERGLPVEPRMRARIAQVWGGEDEVPETVTPGCFPTKHRFFAWLRSVEKSHEGGVPVTFCTDCTRERQTAMKSQFRCAFPDVVFDSDPDGWVRGRRV